MRYLVCEVKVWQFYRYWLKKTVSVSELRKEPTDYFLDEPVAVLSNNKTVGYMVSAALFEQMVKLLESKSQSSQFRPSSKRLASIAALGAQQLLAASDHELADFEEQCEFLKVALLFDICYRDIHRVNRACALRTRHSLRSSQSIAFFKQRPCCLSYFFPTAERTNEERPLSGKALHPIFWQIKQAGLRRSRRHKPQLAILAN
ncbi:hypothetical protein [Flavobacterium sp. W21_SRS_FM6]|uniref:hypothetical protein n=1 Tax=Flavobacterium sp. W21_SRS_FM6 TaxID=3240268 RepID=UPI003F8DAA09